MGLSDRTQRLGVVSSRAIDLTAAVVEAEFGANTMLYATTDDAPVALTVAEQRVVGRITGGDIAALTSAQVRTMLGLPQENLTATGAPGANDDAADGYSVGSVWVDTSADVAYICLLATTGAAEWAAMGGA